VWVFASIKQVFTNNNAGVCLGHFSFDAGKATDQLRRRSRLAFASVDSAMFLRLLRCRCALGRGFLSVTLVEAVNASGGIDEFLFTGEKWMAS
jgi:hypothetical protein